MNQFINQQKTKVWFNILHLVQNFYMTDGPVEKPDDLKGKHSVMNGESQ